jgi:hypothetical protein
MPSGTGSAGRDAATTFCRGVANMCSVSCSGGLAASLAASLSKAATQADGALTAIADPESGASTIDLAAAFVGVKQANLQVAAAAMVLHTAQQLSDSLLSLSRQ